MKEQLKEDVVEEEEEDDKSNHNTELMINPIDIMADQTSE